MVINDGKLNIKHRGGNSWTSNVGIRNTYYIMFSRKYIWVSNRNQKGVALFQDANAITVHGKPTKALAGIIFNMHVASLVNPKEKMQSKPLRSHFAQSILTLPK
jgi:hypothetical protein